MDPFIINFILFIFIIFLLVILSWVWPPDSPWAPWWTTSKKTARIAAKLARITSKDTVYELGSGDGSFARTIAQEYGCKTIGIEIDRSRNFIAQFLVYVQNIKNITLIKDNFNNQDLSKASVIFLYLVPRAIKRLLPKLRKELRADTRIISYVYKIDLPLIAKNEKEKIYVYRLGKAKK